MQANYVTNVDGDTLLDPEAGVWSNARPETIKLMGTPASMQPTPAIRESWSNKKIGTVENVSLQALHNGNTLAFRLEWDAPNQTVDHGDNSVFPDGAAIAFPVVASAQASTMGAPDAPMNMWFWRANQDGEGQQLSAGGIGTSDTVDHHAVKVRSVRKEGEWSVVISRAMQVISEKPVTQLKTGNNAQFAVAIWNGGDKERGGIKSFSGPAWLDLAVETRG